jgi:hypothetical protein
VRRLVELVDESGGEVGARDGRRAVVGGEQDVAAGAVGAGPLARRVGAEDGGRAEVEPVQGLGCGAQVLEDRGELEGLGLERVGELRAVDDARPAGGDLERSGTADDGRVRLSDVTSCPRPAASRTMCSPAYPVPPITTMRAMCFSLSCRRPLSIRE